MKLSFWLVLWCSVALSNSFEPEFDSGTSLGQYSSKTKIKATAHYILMAWNGVVRLTNLSTNFLKNIQTAENVPKLQLLTVHKVLKIFYDSVELECEIESEKFDNIMLICAPLSTHYQHIFSYWMQSNMQTAENIGNELKQIELIRNKMFEALERYYLEWCLTQNTHKFIEIKLKTDDIYKMNLDSNALTTNEYYTGTSVKAVAHLAFVTWNRTILLGTIFMDPIFSVRVGHRIRSKTIAYFLEMVVDSVEPHSQVQTFRYNNIASKCERLQQHYGKINLDWSMRMHGDDAIVGTLLLEAEGIVVLIDEIIYELLAICPQHKQYDDMRTKLLCHCATWNAKPNRFVKMIIPIAEFFVEIGEQAQLLNREYIGAQLYMATCYQFAMEVFNLFAEYLLEEGLLWPTDIEIEKKIQEHSAVLFPYMKAVIEHTIEDFQNNLLATRNDVDPQVRAVIVRFMATNVGKIATIFYDIIELLFKLLPFTENEKLNTKRLQCAGFMNEVKAFGENMQETL